MKKLKLIVKFISFITSYLPLWFLLFIKYLFLEDSEGNFVLCATRSIGKFTFTLPFPIPVAKFNSVSLIMLFLCVFSLGVTLIFVKRESKKINNRKLLKVINIDSEAPGLLSYIFSYVVIFLDIGGTKDIFIKILYVGLIFYYYNRGDILMYNPTLNFLKYHLCKVKIEGKEEVIYVITKNELSNLEIYNFRHITENIYFL